jgi:hypothetical protein
MWWWESTVSNFCRSQVDRQAANFTERIFAAVLRIRDVYPGSRILIFTHPGSRIPDPGSRISDPGSRIQKQQQKREVKKN